jgi:hypothetical protein
MGSITKMLQNISGADEDAKERTERLEMLLKLARAKIETYKDKINMNFSNPGTIDKIQIPGNRAMRYIEQYHVVTKEGLNEKVADHLDAAIDAFFSIGSDNVDTKKAVQGGVKSLISTALSGFIGSTEAGESEEIIYIVVPENNAFVRADIACWKYHFEQHKFIDQADTAIAYILCKSVIDHTKITLDELIYLATEAMSTRQEKKSLVDKALTDAANAAADTTGDLKTVKDKLADVTKCYPTTEIDKKGSKRPPEPTDKSVFDTALKKLNEQLITYLKLPKEKVITLGIDFKWKEGASDKTKGYWEPFIFDPTLDGTHSSATPASLPEVAAYIEEMIKVWRKLKEDRASSS